MSRIALFGASGMIGSRIATEARDRGHDVTELRSANVDIRDPEAVTGAVTGHDAVISAAGDHHDPTIYRQAAFSLLSGLPRAGVSRLIVVGGAGSLEVSPGVPLIETPDFPSEWKVEAAGQADALEVYRNNDTVDWTYVSPAAVIQPGQRTGTYRVGGDQLLVDGEGQSRISAEDYAAGIVDELERPAHLRERITIAY